MLIVGLMVNATSSVMDKHSACVVMDMVERIVLRYAFAMFLTNSVPQYCPTNCGSAADSGYSREPGDRLACGLLSGCCLSTWQDDESVISAWLRFAGIVFACAAALFLGCRVYRKYNEDVSYSQIRGENGEIIQDDFYGL